jgi:hypothetical protein
MKPGDKRYIPIPREAHLVMNRLNGMPGRDGDIWCSHSEPVIAALSERIKGWFWLVDDETWQHSIITDACREELYGKLIQAIQACRRGEQAPVRWAEEWEVTRVEDSDEEPRSTVQVIAVTEARSAISSTHEAIDVMLEAALAKFWKRWAKKHVIIFENQFFSFCSPENVADWLTGVEPEYLASIDLIIVVDHGVATRVWQSSPRP